MKYLFSTFILLLSLFSVHGQTAADSLIILGAQYFDNGQYKEAIEKYKQALELDPESDLVHYELAYTYLQSGNYERSIEHSDIVLTSSMEDNLLLGAYNTKGSALNSLGRTDEAIKILKEGIEKYSENYLLYYNLAMAYYKAKDYDQSEEAFIHVLDLHPYHSSSHWGLARIKAEQGKRVQSILSSYFFLFVETETYRSEYVYNTLKNIMTGNGNNSQHINTLEADSEFKAADLMLNALSATGQQEENKDKTEEEIFIKNTKSFFNILAKENNESKSTNNIWWGFYVSFFSDIVQSEHIDTFCYYISQNGNDSAREWINDNTDKLKKFDKWLQGEN